MTISSPMTVNQLIEQLQQHASNGAGEEPVYVNTHGHGYPLTMMEPGDGLEGLHLIGLEGLDG
jgi:hypothetical protein